MSFRFALCSCVFTLTLSVASTASFANVNLIPHRAVYDLEIKNTTERAGVEALSGRMVFEFTGSACLGYKTDFRFVTNIVANGTSRITDQQTVTMENTEDKSFVFQTKTFTDEKLDKDLYGTARAIDEKILIDIQSPEKQQITLTESQFPVQHLINVIEQAKKGNRNFEAKVFDGSDDGDEALLVSTLVGKIKSPAKDDLEIDKLGDIGKQKYWPVSIAYFKDEVNTDSNPIYRMSFKLHENGITRGLTMDYGDFAISARLAKFDQIDNEPCEGDAKAQ